MVFLCVGNVLRWREDVVDALVDGMGGTLYCSDRIRDKSGFLLEDRSIAPHIRSIGCGAVTRNQAQARSIGYDVRSIEQASISRENGFVGFV